MNIRESMRLYLVTDDTSRSSEDLARIVDAAIAGGVTAVQFRERSLESRSALDAWLRLRAVCDERAVPLLVNASCLAALTPLLEKAAPSLHWDGVHYGRQTAPSRFPRDVLTGYSAHEIVEAGAALARGVSFVTLSPVFQTPSKPGAAGRGTQFLREARQMLGGSILVALGGISPDNVRETIASGADAVAVIRAIMGARDPRSAAAALRDSIEQELARKGP